MKNGQGAHCNIICTQPRKISAISVADRVAYERKESVGLSVGYSVRFDCIFPRPYGAILFCTVGKFFSITDFFFKFKNYTKIYIFQVYYCVNWKVVCVAYHI